MKRIALLLLLSFGISIQSNDNQDASVKNEFVNTNKQEDLAEIGKILNNAIEAFYKVLPKETLEKPEVKKNIEVVSVFLKDTTKMEMIVAGKLNDNEIKAVLILLKKLSTVQELQYLPMMFTVSMIRAKELIIQNKDLINAGLKCVMLNCGKLIETLNNYKASEQLSK